MLDGLPTHSRMMAALSNDEDAVREALMAQQDKPKKDSGPSLAEWSTEANLLAQVNDGIKQLISLLVKVNSRPGTQTPRFDPTARPSTVWPKIEYELRMQKHQSLVAILIRNEE